MISDNIGALIMHLEPYQRSGLTLSAEAVYATLAVLRSLHADVMALETTAVPPAARVCREPPWGWGENVVPLVSTEAAS